MSEVAQKLKQEPSKEPGKPAEVISFADFQVPVATQTRKARAVLASETAELDDQMNAATVLAEIEGSASDSSEGGGVQSLPTTDATPTTMQVGQPVGKKKGFWAKLFGPKER